MSYFLKSGNTFKVSTKEAMDLHDHLPAGNYTVKYDKMNGFFYLEQIEGFEIKGKIYGDTKRTAQRILNTFQDRTASTGIMLNGEKGSGKTLLAKMLAVEGAKLNVPTIVINAPWCGDEFNAFMQMIDQPTIILFDEFEKVYDREDQEKMLTLLDGVYPSKKLFVLTCNDKWRVNEHMRNRPGRIYYMLEYKGLDQEFIIEYCQDNLKNQTHISGVCRIATLFDQFNFDMLKAMVEEMNRYDESPQQVMKMLNTRPEFSGEVKYKVQLQPKGLDMDEKFMEQTEWVGNPLTQNVSLDYKVYENPEDKESDWDWENCRFTHQDLKQVDSGAGKFVFINDLGDRVTLSRVKETSFRYFDAF
jgi:SpoVK/Ycf46/Vps4 family AAA+-type ATPase